MAYDHPKQPMSELVRKLDENSLMSPASSDDDEDDEAIIIGLVCLDGSDCIFYSY